MAGLEAVLVSVLIRAIVRRFGTGLLYGLWAGIGIAAVILLVSGEELLGSVALVVGVLVGTVALGVRQHRLPKRIMWRWEEPSPSGKEALEALGYKVGEARERVSYSGWTSLHPTPVVATGEAPRAVPYWLQVIAAAVGVLTGIAGVVVAIVALFVD